jgi:hypothetical protein
MSPLDLAQVWQDAHLNLSKAVDYPYHIFCELQKDKHTEAKVGESA